MTSFIKMIDIDFIKLNKIVKDSTKKNYSTYVSNGKPIPNLANLGGKVGDVFKLQREGEYNGIAVEIMEPLRPILTQHFVQRILFMLKNEDYMTILQILDLNSIDEIYYILHTWFEVATTDYDMSLKSTFKKKYPSFDQWIESVTHDPILGKIKIAEVGYNAKTDMPVVPEDWIGREFKNGFDLHSEMDKLDTRLGKPPVTYAIIYSMVIVDKDEVLEDISKIKFDNIFYIGWTNSHTFKTELTTEIKKGYHYVMYKKTAIGFKLDEILEPKKSGPKSAEVGLLVSRLQKAIRRGRYGSKALIETIDAINSSPNYNLPEHAFLRVSASRQLVWRLFITILEDCRPYQEIDEPSLLDLLLLSLITQKAKEYQFTPAVLSAIKVLALLAQYNDTEYDSYDWRAESEADKTPLTNSDFHNAISLALDHVTMMGGDRRMLAKYYSTQEQFEPFIIPTKLKNLNGAILKDKYILSDDKVYEDIILSSYDMHSKPHIILYYQACIPISMTTKEISNYIWDTSSKYNVRYHSEQIFDPILRSIQKYLWLGDRSLEKKNFKDQLVDGLVKMEPNTNQSRTSFLILFGTKYRSGGKDLIIAGSKTEPIRIKNKNEWEYSAEKKYLNAYPTKTVKVSDIDPPFGFKWIGKKFHTSIENGKPMIDGNEVSFFDGSSVITSIRPSIESTIKKKLYDKIISILSGIDIDFNFLIKLRQNDMSKLRNWIPKKSDFRKIDSDLLLGTYTKLFNQFDNIIQIGPVSRSGNKMQNSINYYIEGKIWAVFNLLSYLYPDTIKPSGTLNFIVKKTTPGYVHLVETLEQILFRETDMVGSVPKIKTKLWDHQQNSVKRIVAGFTKGRHGFGDASDVGSGKTLSALKISTELIKTDDSIHSGILVLLPGNKLIDTWREEIEKHTKGFDTIFQKNSSNIGSINRNSIIITTVARIRDHPINHRWLLVVIDECLTVQNKNSLQSESAWKQSLMSKYLVMMSATFFRTRFDKLYYMLKMLQTGLPERKEYLDTILLESIVSQIPSIKRNWTSNFNYFEMDSKTKDKYSSITKSDMALEVKFAKLSALLVSSAKTNQYVVDQLAGLIAKLEKKKRRCLIYARAKAEAEFWSTELNIPIYPIKGTHCIVTYHDGTYGLNDLIIYDTIVMRPPAPDTLPQIKGRLDRPGNKSNDLYIEYFVLKDTIEEGLILRLEIASQFVQKYIMPLAKFYDVSVNYKKYLKKN